MLIDEAKYVFQVCSRRKAVVSAYLDGKERELYVYKIMYVSIYFRATFNSTN